MLLWSICFLCQFGIAQEMDSIFLSKLEAIYAPGKCYHYKAVMIDVNGDTISNELIRMNIPKDLNMDEKRDRVYFVWEYDYSDEVAIQLEPKTLEVINRSWMKNDTTTLSFREDECYIHPIRENQYYQVELAPHPKIGYDQSIQQEYNSTIFVIKNYGQYNMTKSFSTYQLVGEEKLKFNDAFLKCYHIHAIAEAQKFGESTADFYFNETYGFLKMYYQLYGGEQLWIEMVEVE